MCTNIVEIWYPTGFSYTAFLLSPGCKASLGYPILTYRINSGYYMIFNLSRFKISSLLWKLGTVQVCNYIHDKPHLANEMVQVVCTLLFLINIASIFVCLLDSKCRNINFSYTPEEDLGDPIAN